MRVVIGWKSVLYESLYDQAQLCTHSDWFSLMIYWRTMVAENCHSKFYNIQRFNKK